MQDRLRTRGWTLGVDRAFAPLPSLLAATERYGNLLFDQFDRHGVRALDPALAPQLEAGAPPEGHFHGPAEMDTDASLHLAWITLLLTRYYDPMYLYQLGNKRERILFQGDKQACLDFFAKQRA